MGLIQLIKDYITYEDDEDYCYNFQKKVLPENLDQRKKDYCTQLAYDAEEYDEIEAYSVAYILSQTHPKMVFKAFYDVFLKEL